MADNQETEEEVFALLSGLNAEELTEVCNTLELDETEVAAKQGNKRALLKMALRYLSSEEVEKMEDSGLSTFLMLQAHILLLNKAKVKVEKPETLDTENFENDIKLENLETPKTNNKTKDSVYVEPTADTKLKTLQKLNNFKSIPPVVTVKEFKIQGKIGALGQKDKLTFTSLNYQMENGLKKGYEESEICFAVISSVSPDSELRGFLEGKSNLTLQMLRKILRSHFKEKDSSTLFTMLSNAKQNVHESPEEFVIRLMNLRQKLIYVSKEDQYEYDEKLIKRKFLKSIFTGLKNENLRNELRPLLNTDTVEDDDLLEALNLAITNETEHLEKLSISKKVSSCGIEVESEKQQKRNPIIDEMKSGKRSV